MKTKKKELKPSKIALYLQFEDDEPQECCSGEGNRINFSVPLNESILFRDHVSGKKFKLLVKEKGNEKANNETKKVC